MNAWKPTDEQIEALRRQDCDENGADYDAFPREFHDRLNRLYREQFESPAFQSIIRAAQAEAYDRGVETGIGWALATPSAVSAGRQVADVSNPYKDAS